MLLDEQDTTGPAGNADLDRQMVVMPADLVRRDGVFSWRMGDDLKTSFRAADGMEMEASAFSVNDVIGLATATQAPNIEFHLAVATSSTRRRGEPFSTETIIEISGQDHAGQSLRLGPATPSFTLEDRCR